LLSRCLCSRSLSLKIEIELLLNNLSLLWLIDNILDELVAYIKSQLRIATRVSVIKVNVFIFHVITWVCFDLLTSNLLSGMFGLLFRYLGASSKPFAYNRIFSFWSITSVHFDLLITVTSKLCRWKPGISSQCGASCFQVQIFHIVIILEMFH
jgi:hypothetical protein